MVQPKSTAPARRTVQPGPALKKDEDLIEHRQPSSVSSPSRSLSSNTLAES